jgi:diphthine-ammonia ligase
MPLSSHVLVECIAQKGRHVDVLHVQSISRWAPACIGPYSQAYTADSITYLAGQIGLDPPTMTLVPSLEDQITLSFQHIESVAQAVKTSLKSALCATVYVTDIQLQSKIVELMPTANQVKPISEETYQLATAIVP